MGIRNHVSGRWLVAALALALTGGILGADPAPKIYCYTLSPFVTDDQGKPTGMALDLVGKILRKAGLEEPVLLVPLPRAVDALNGGNALVVMLARTPERETKYTWICEVYEDSLSFATPAAAPAIGTYAEGQAAKTILAMRNAAPSATLKKKGFQNVDDSAETEDVNVRKLASGRGDAWFGSTAAIRFLLKQTKAEALVTVGKPVQTLPFWLVASKDLAPDTLVRLEAAAKELKAAGAFDSAFLGLK